MTFNQFNQCCACCAITRGFVRGRGSWLGSIIRSVFFILIGCDRFM